MKSSKESKVKSHNQKASRPQRQRRQMAITLNSKENCMACSSSWRVGEATSAGDCPVCGKTSGYEPRK